MTSKTRPEFPIYVVSKGRADYMVTTRTLTQMGVPHYVVCEPDEFEDYRKASRGTAATPLELDLTYKERYETCDRFGTEYSTGPGPARNFAWDHAIASGYAWHWVMDDNIEGFHRFNDNLKVPARTPGVFAAMEDFCLRYRNVAMAGPQYFSFVPRKKRKPPFTPNTRIYSCNLIRNDVPFRWRGRYNEDTIISLDMLKAGWCTVLFNAFLQFKAETQKYKGGNTDEFYHAEGRQRAGQKYAAGGTIAKSQMLAAVHPDVARVVWKFSRWHHEVDYSRFRHLGLIRRDDIEVADESNEYGMRLRYLSA